MALRHVKEYYKQVEDQYFRMLKKTKEFDEALKEGLFDQEKYNQALSMTSKIEENYKRIAFTMFLWSKPNKKSKKHRFESQNKHKIEKFAGNTDADVINENEDILKKFYAYVDEIKDSKNNE